MEINTSLQLLSQPDLSNSIMICAWEGWADASESATRAVSELIRQTGAEKFATIDPEEFYVFSENRPIVSNGNEDKRVLHWTSNAFYFKKIEGKGKDIIFFKGTEPNLQWRHYAEHFARIACICDTQLLITLGALLASVPHTRPPRIRGSSSSPALGQGFEHVHYPKPDYEGPSGMTSVVAERLSVAGIPSASIWAHAPHYLRARHNPVLTAGIIREVTQFLPTPLNLQEIQKEADKFDENISKALEDEEDIKKYVAALEEEFDSDSEPLPNVERKSLVEELEEYLRKQRSGEE